MPSTRPPSDLQDLAALIRADTALIVIETPDESRVVDLFRQSLLHVWRALYRWTITEGLRRIDMDREDDAEVAPDASTTLTAIKEAEQRGVYLLLDFHPYLGYASTSASCATWPSAAAASRTCWCWWATRWRCRTTWRHCACASPRDCPTPTRCRSWCARRPPRTPASTAAAGWRPTPRWSR